MFNIYSINYSTFQNSLKALKIKKRVKRKKILKRRSNNNKQLILLLIFKRIPYFDLIKGTIQTFIVPGIVFLVLLHLLN